jgi:membrane associated rhomboid family serine protease
MTRLFVGGCILVFVWSALDAGLLNLFDREGGIEALLLGGRTSWEKLRWGALATQLVSTEPWRLLSATFVHFGLLHVGFNMLAIISLGRALEPQLGPARYIVTLLGTALFGFVTSHVWHTQVSPFHGLTAGASGGVLGLAGALIGYLYARGNPAWKQIGAQVVLYAVLFAVMLPVNNAAHAGGLLSGLPLGYLFCKERRRHRHAWAFRWLAGAFIAASVASIVLSHTSDVWRAERARDLIRQNLRR